MTGSPDEGSPKAISCSPFSSAMKLSKLSRLFVGFVILVLLADFRGL